MNQVGSDTAQWHLEQAEIQLQAAESAERKHYWYVAQTRRDKAQWHRKQAAALDRKDDAA